jgi:polysaccharide export outer membrane protein
VRILVYNEPTLSGEFVVNSNGAIAVPLIGDVVATNRTATELSLEITARLSQGYLRDPRVSIDVVNFRPFYILGEVNKPGEYPYSNGLTVLNAVATAQGFTYRADKRRVYIKSAGKEAEEALPLSSGVEVKPGDTIRIGERYF